MSLETISFPSVNAFSDKLFPDFIQDLSRSDKVRIRLEADLMASHADFQDTLKTLSSLRGKNISLSLVTYLKNPGDRGPYFAEGISWDLWKKRLILVKECFIHLDVKIFTVVSIFSVPFLTKFILDLEELEKTHGIRTTLAPGVSLIPPFLEPEILGKKFLSPITETLRVFENSTIGSDGFFEYLESLSRGILPEHAGELRADFYQFIRFRDSGRQTDFQALYPELAPFYRMIVPLKWDYALAEVNRARKTASEKRICFAPSKNLSLNTKGNVGACYATWNYDPEASYPKKSLKELWFGDYMNSVRRGVSENCLEKHCGLCLTELKNDNFTSPLLSGYNDYPVNENGYPSIIDIEVSNKCNLQCIMCDGDHSSMIRKHEGRPPMVSPYDDVFLEQLREFIPHLKEMRFQGGEPLLDSYYYRIWELALELNPSIRLVITTNGTVYNSRFENILNKMSVYLTVSIDAFEASVYEKIRVNAKFEETISNLRKYIAKSRERGFPLRVVVTPMTENWAQIPGILAFCNENEIEFWIHHMTNPPNLSLRYLSVAELKKISEALEARRPEHPGPRSETIFTNFMVYNNFIENQVRKWI